jgi:hypothetical protein
MLSGKLRGSYGEVTQRVHNDYTTSTQRVPPPCIIKTDFTYLIKRAFDRIGNVSQTYKKNIKKIARINSTPKVIQACLCTIRSILQVTQRVPPTCTTTMHRRTKYAARRRLSQSLSFEGTTNNPPMNVWGCEAMTTSAMLALSCVKMSLLPNSEDVANFNI